MEKFRGNNYAWAQAEEVKRILCLINCKRIATQFVHLDTLERISGTKGVALALVLFRDTS